jgi:hypothetical protein
MARFDIRVPKNFRQDEGAIFFPKIDNSGVLTILILDN